jgi:hypothetical protein
MTTHLRYDNQTRAETDETVIATLVRKGWEVFTPEPVVEVAPLVTAEEHLKSVGLGGERQPTLLYLRQSLAAAGQQSPELDAIEQYLQQILSIFASDPSPRNDWPQPPITFEAAVQSAMQTLLVTPEQSVGGNP